MIWLQLDFEIRDLDFDNKNDSIIIRIFVNIATNDNQLRNLIFGHDVGFSKNGSEYELIATIEQSVSLGEIGRPIGRGSSDIIRSEKKGNYNVN